MTTKQYAESLWQALSETSPTAHDAIIQKFITIISEAGKQDKLEEIIAEVEILANIANKPPVEATFASEDSASKKLLDSINKIANSDSLIKVKIDEGLIGGVIIRSGDTLIDASLKGELETLSKTLKNDHE